jgi:hypothetical protein
MSHRRRQGPTGNQVNRGRASYRQATRAIQPGRPFSRASDGAAPLSSGDERQAMRRLQEAKSIARHLGLTLRLQGSGNYRVNFRDGNETTAYYTDNLEDAVNTAVEMARKRSGITGTSGDCQTGSRSPR